MRCGLGSNGEPKRRSKRTAKFDGWIPNQIRIKNGFEEFWSGGPVVDGLPLLDLDVSDVKIFEKV